MRVANRGWKRPFDDPIPLPRGRQLVTLQDAGKYSTKLPKREHEAAEWQAAMEALILVATFGRPGIGPFQAISRPGKKETGPSRGAKLRPSSVLDETGTSPTIPPI